MKIDKTTQARWENRASLWLQERGFTIDVVRTISEAWRVAFILDLPREAYRIDPSINDNHIETALIRIFPSVQRRTK